jgi:predicted ester cyclase
MRGSDACVQRRFGRRRAAIFVTRSTMRRQGGLLRSSRLITAVLGAAALVTAHSGRANSQTPPAPLPAAAVSPAAVDDNRRVVRQHHERLNAGDWQAALLDYAEDTRNFGRPVGRDGLRATFEDIYTTFPDWKMEIVDLVAEGDWVVVRCTVSGTHKGVGKRPINGGMLVGVAPTGKRFEVQHIHWYTVRGGKIVDHRATRDDIGMNRQLGLLPPAPGPG